MRLHPAALGDRRRAFKAAVLYSKVERLMYALGHKRTSRRVNSMSALPPKADVVQHGSNVCFVPKADIDAPSDNLRFTPESGHQLNIR